MNNTPQKKPGYLLKTAVLAVGTTVLVCGLIGRLLYIHGSAPQAVSGRMNNGGWGFTVVAMDGSRPVELVHEWSGLVSGSIGIRAGAPEGVSRAELESLAGMGIVWADTGRASVPLRYYLTKSDIMKATSQFSSDDHANWRSFRIEVTEDDPATRSQTVTVRDSTEMDDVTSVYRVERERVHPLAWSRIRPITVGIPVLLISPLVLAASGFLWARVLQNAGRRARGIDTHRG